TGCAQPAGRARRVAQAAVGRGAAQEQKTLIVQRIRHWTAGALKLRGVDKKHLRKINVCLSFAQVVMQKSSSSTARSPTPSP
ncbi:MAG: hypothetical protein V3T11_19415, partial [Roseateles sp.]